MVYDSEEHLSMSLWDLNFDKSTSVSLGGMPLLRFTQSHASSLLWKPYSCV
ncbi:predicted protein [Botrytis cinerea T4]|uniref:Uncharacterized protein n=1 Tax=Botryotinia fuckeliana (strain T4) TaxID=999810 RepID=G2Y6R1_BOTF4|nr:predicted protein [Botrytis cinerea T4]